MEISKMSENKLNQRQCLHKHYRRLDMEWPFVVFWPILVLLWLGHIAQVENLKTSGSYNVFDNFPHLADLQLAAQLGKVLLDRNKDLEEQVRGANLIQYEQAKEIEVTRIKSVLLSRRKLKSSQCI